MADIQINELLESTTAANSDWIAIDNGSATKKISVQNFNATGAASAAQSAAAAAQSASDASDAKTAAVAAKDDAQALITSAQTIVSDAQTYANNASTSAGTASTAANTATAQAAIATNQANLAAGYASNVDTWAKTAKSWAVGGTGTRSGEDTDNSKYYSQQAHTSEINAAASETNASSSESNAAASEGIASAAANSAEADALKAEGYAVGSQNGTPVVSGTYYQNNAKYYKEQAATSETNAASSEYNAGLSKTAAAASESAAKESEDDSEAWAWGKVDGVDVPPSHPAYHNNAKYYADQASGGVSGVSSFNARTGNVVPALGDYAANIVAFDNTGSSLQSTTTQAAIEEVQGNVEALSTVARTGSYADLTNKPTLGTAAAKDSTNAVTQSSTDLVESGAVYTAMDDKMDKVNPTGSGTVSIGRRGSSTIGENSVAMGRNVVAGGAGAVAFGIGSEASSFYTFAGGFQSKSQDSGAFAYGIGTISDKRCKAVFGAYNNNRNNTVFEIGNGSADDSRSNIFEVYSDGTISTDNGTTKIDITLVGKKLTAQTLAAGSTTLTFSDASITTDSTVEAYASVYGIAPTNIAVTTGQAVLTFKAQQTAISVYLIIK